MSAEPHLWVVTYDVSSPKRWRRVYKTLRRRGAWQQLSAFVCRLTPARASALERELLSHIDPVTDRLMMVDLGSGRDAENRFRRHGPGMMPLPRARTRIF